MVFLERWLLVLLVCVAVRGKPKKKTPDALVELVPGSDKKVFGKLALYKTEHGKVYIEGTIHNAAPGSHGFHVHDKGLLGNKCKDAGPHFNPRQKKHAGPLDAHRHAGDLGNVLADKNGKIKINLLDNHISLDPKSKNFIGKRSFVVHAKPDDLGRGGDAESLKTGNAGARLACGIVVVLGHSFNQKPPVYKKSKGNEDYFDLDGFSDENYDHDVAEDRHFFEDYEKDQKKDGSETDYFEDGKEYDDDEDYFFTPKKDASHQESIRTHDDGNHNTLKSHFKLFKDNSKPHGSTSSSDSIHQKTFLTPHHTAPQITYSHSNPSQHKTFHPHFEHNNEIVHHKPTIHIGSGKSIRPHQPIINHGKSFSKHQPQILIKPKPVVHHQTVHHKPTVHHAPVAHKQTIHHKPSVHHAPTVHHETVHHKSTVHHANNVHHQTAHNKPTVHHETVHHGPTVHKQPIHHKPFVHHNPHDHKQTVHHKPTVHHAPDVHKQTVHRNPNVDHRNRYRRPEAHFKPLVHHRTVNDKAAVHHHQTIHHQPNVHHQTVHHFKQSHQNTHHPIIRHQNPYLGAPSFNNPILYSQPPHSFKNNPYSFEPFVGASNHHLSFSPTIQPHQTFIPQPYPIAFPSFAQPPVHLW